MKRSRDSADAGETKGVPRSHDAGPGGNAPSFAALLAALDPKRPVLVQTHDFPDHDALGAAYALCELLLRRGFDSAMTYGGAIQSISLSEMIGRLEIKLVPFAEAVAGADWQTIVVDGSPASGTVRAVAGSLVAIVDHHPAKRSISVPFADVRTDCGSCSSIVWTYWKEAREEPDRTTATALLAGIQLDTDFLSRRVSETDLDAHRDLFFRGNNELAHEIVRTSLSVDQLADIGRAFGSFRRANGALLAEVSGDYPQELLSVLADFLLRLKEVSFVVVIETGGGEYRLSARTRDRAIDTGHVIRHALSGIGTGGGHPHMAGGFIKPERYPGGDAFLAKIVEEIAACRSQE